MDGTPRTRARDQTMREIIRIGRVHMAAEGAAALSLRGVARELGVVSSAVYRYVNSRDELLTLLVVDGYNQLGDQAEMALAQVDDGDARGQFRALARSVRSWALREPASYALLFGSPVPGYSAPADRTTGPGTRVIGLLVNIIERAYLAGALAPATTGGLPVDPVLAADLAAVRAEMAISAPDAVLTRGVLVWASLFGIVSFEVFGQYGPATFTDPAQLFEHHLEALEKVLGFS